ncbi:hypothetical protein [Natrialbaceae archaeon AArc-T1-2]|uniref:hypothetical protein n=1 Tax=Natrialbaceae archaeon AArc-T1-2 TaxID=3053904 RepID=UPI00255A87AE|nr:hypothetical protein [Natrialbaceae archaeon AArc-T1-2]WIV66254.1 hypothetical protein QQ977_11190 [Natrialbaceae archaeon AArc-T1-2]
MADAIDLVERSLADDTRETFDQRVDDQAVALAEALRAGRLDSPGFGLGLELEIYAVDADGRLARVPDDVFETACEREFGRHNAELNTDPDPFDDAGIVAQAEQLRRRYRRAQEAAGENGLEFVLDAMWTVPPAAGTDAYLSDVRERDGYTVAENMTPSPRYRAIDNDVIAHAGGTVTLSVPGVDREFPSMLFESLTSSIQPHVQVPDVGTFPRYYNTAIRTLGPVLALATNSPLLPPDLYDVDDPFALLEKTYHELRIPVFEQSIDDAWEKVRFPDGLERTVDALEYLVDDPTCAPFLKEWLSDGERETFGERFWELDHKRGTYWRWLRAVLGGQPIGEGDAWSMRIEYRPLPTQPTIVDNVGVQCLVAGLVRGLVDADHPLATLEADAAERCFYDVVTDGLEADLAWITADGTWTSDPDTIYEELFDYARRGLRAAGASPETIAAYLEPIEQRWHEETTPSAWKLELVRSRLERGESFAEAVRGMQAEYRTRAGTGEPFVRWPEGR